jgi:hypothetical protein
MSSPTDQQSFLHAILRQDFEAFVQKVFHTLCPGQTFIPAWYIRAVAYQLERIRRGEIRRLIINLPPRSLKSIMASVALPAYNAADYLRELFRRASLQAVERFPRSSHQLLVPGPLSEH